MKDRFFDNDIPGGYYNSNSACYANELLFEFKMHLSQTSFMVSDTLFDNAIDVRDSSVDKNAGDLYDD